MTRLYWGHLNYIFILVKEEPVLGQPFIPGIYLLLLPETILCWFLFKLCFRSETETSGGSC